MKIDKELFLKKKEGRAIESPEWLLDKWNEYIEYCKKNNIERQERGSREPMIISVPRVPTFNSFCAFLQIPSGTVREYQTKPVFDVLISLIKERIHANASTLAMAQVISPAFTGGYFGTEGAESDKEEHSEQVINLVLSDNVIPVNSVKES